MMADWSQIPEDLLCRIASNHLKSIEDFAMFSYICHSWYRCYTMVKSAWNPSPNQIPWLLFPEDDLSKTTIGGDSNKYSCRRIYNPSADKWYMLKLPVEALQDRRCWGLDYGWVATVGRDLEMHLFNPLSGVRLGLPPINTFGDDYDKFCSAFCFEEINVYRYVRKVRMFKIRQPGGNEQDKHQLVVMVIHGLHNWLSYARPDDASWTRILDPDHCICVADIAHCNGLFYILSRDYPCLYVLDGNLRPISSPYSMDGMLHDREDLIRFTDEKHMLEYSGALLVVARFKNRSLLEGYSDDHDYESFTDHEGITWFLVHKFDFQSKTWKRLKDLGDVALFVGHNHAISIQASHSVNCKGNCIYFTNDSVRYWEMKYAASHDMGLYNMEDGSIKPLSEEDGCYSEFFSPIWFMPNIN